MLLLFVVIGIVLVVWGSDVTVDAATMIARAEVADGDTCNKQHYGNSCVYSDISKRKVEKGRVCCPASRQFVFLSLRFPISVSRP